MIIIEDNFFDDPYKVRGDALSAKYESSPDTRWPGYRAPVPFYISNKINSWVEEKTGFKHSIKESNFQYIPKKYGNGIYHLDTPFQFTAIVYLNPDPPKNSGTSISEEIYNPSNSFWDECNVWKKLFYNNLDNQYYRFRFDLKRKKVEKMFPVSYNIPAKFNRILLFDSCLKHCAQQFYGKSKADSRITIASFFRS